MKSDKIKKVAEELSKSIMKNISEHPAMIAAGDTDNEIMVAVASTLVMADEIIKSAVNELNAVAKKYQGVIEESDIDEIAAVAHEFDKSGDEFLAKQASVLDQLLVNFAQISGTEAKKAQDTEIEKIRAKYRSESSDQCYKGPSEKLERDIKATESAKEIEKQVKKFRPLEAPLSTRTCPDHPGAQVSRIADNVYQCCLDGKIYNYNEGFKTLKGNEVPGTSVEEQTRALSNRAVENMSFSTREEELNK